MKHYRSFWLTISLTVVASLVLSACGGAATQAPAATSAPATSAPPIPVSPTDTPIPAVPQELVIGVAKD
jgi:ABC-type glycerol-3-phosphate transport system substrate-binding protein